MVLMGKVVERSKPRNGKEKVKGSGLADLRRIETIKFPTMRLTNPLNENEDQDADYQREYQAQRMLRIAIRCLELWNIPKSAWKKENQSFLSGLTAVWGEKVGVYNKLTESEVLEALEYIHINGILDWFACRPTSVEIGEVAIPASDLDIKTQELKLMLNPHLLRTSSGEKQVA